MKFMNKKKWKNLLSNKLVYRANRTTIEVEDTLKKGDRENAIYFE